MTVEEYITCPKTIQRKRKPPFVYENRHYRADVELECPGCKQRMKMFMRKSVDFPEDFSIGLRLEGPNEFLEYTVVLLRYQGPHGGQSADRNTSDLHNNHHVHIYTQNDFDCRRKKASYAGPGMFSSFEEAVVMFLKHCNISDPNGIFEDEQNATNQIRMNLDGLMGGRQ